MSLMADTEIRLAAALVLLKNMSGGMELYRQTAFALTMTDRSELCRLMKDRLGEDCPEIFRLGDI